MNSSALSPTPRAGHPLLSRLRRARALVAVLAFVFLAAGCKTGENPISGNTRAYGYSWEQEKQIGAQNDKAILAQYGEVQDKQLQQYVDRVGQRVLAESHLRRPDAEQKFKETEFTFRVLDSPVVNAFALPGGYIYVTRGLMAHLNNEAQLAVVLGHEIGHVAGRHASKRAAKQQFAQLGLLGAALGGQAAGLPGGDILQLGGQAAQLLFLKYSRSDEEESDEVGVEYAAMAGYKASEGAEFFRSLERIQEQSGQSLPTFLSTHPDPGNREQEIIEMAQQWEQRLQTPMTTVEQDQYYRQIEGVVLGENPRNGFTENGMFYHPDLRFQFPVPRGFQVVNQASQVILVDQNQRAQMGFSIAQEASSPREAVSKVTNQRGVQVLDQGQARSGNLPASYVLVQAQTQQGQNLRALFYALEYDGQVYVFQGITSEGAYAEYEDQFLRTMRGFERLTDRSILNVEPTRLNVSPAQRSGSFESFIPRNLPRDMTAQDLAILNQVQLDTRIEAGRELKLPRG